MIVVRVEAEPIPEQEPSPPDEDRAKAESKQLSFEERYVILQFTGARGLLFELDAPLVESGLAAYVMGNPKKIKSCFV